jgi:hypothetical protein
LRAESQYVVIGDKYDKKHKKNQADCLGCHLRSECDGRTFYLLNYQKEKMPSIEDRYWEDIEYGEIYAYQPEEI